MNTDETPDVFIAIYDQDPKYRSMKHRVIQHLPNVLNVFCLRRC